MCPCCGYCPACGRRNLAPYNPFQPPYPPYIPPLGYPWGGTTQPTITYGNGTLQTIQFQQNT